MILFPLIGMKLELLWIGKNQPARYMWEGGLADRVEIRRHIAHMVVLLLVTTFFRITCQTTLFVGRWPSRSGMIGLRANKDGGISVLMISQPKLYMKFVF